MLRALLTVHALAPVLDALLNHINFEEFVMAGMLLAHPSLTLPVVLSNYSDCSFSGDVARSGKDKQQNRWQNVLQVGAPLVLCCVWPVASPAFADLWADWHLQCLQQSCLVVLEVVLMLTALWQDVFVRADTTRVSVPRVTIDCACCQRQCNVMSTNSVQCVELMSAEPA